MKDVHSDVVDCAAVLAGFEVPGGPAAGTQWVLGGDGQRANRTDDSFAKDLLQLAHHAGLHEVQLAADGEIFFLREAGDLIEFVQCGAKRFVGDDVFAGLQRGNGLGSPLGIDIAKGDDGAAAFFQHVFKGLMGENDLSARA